MEISILNSTLTGPDIGPTPPKLLDQAAIRANIFRFLLSGVAKPGSRVVDLAAGPCLFAMIARDEGSVVTAVDARIERKPPDDELGPIRFIQSDIRNFDLAGFDVIVCLGMLYHFDVEDQVRFLEKCAQSGAPLILETQIHVDALVPTSQTGEWARNVVRRGKYEGVVFPEQNNLMASIGNTESFWATERSLLRMIEDAGFKNVAIVDPIYQSKYGARRYYLLNCENFVANPDVVASIALNVECAKFADLVNQERFDEAHAFWERLTPPPESAEDWSYRMAVARMRLHFGESEKAVLEIKKLRDRALSGDRWSTVLLRCADLFEMAGDPLEAEKTRAAAYERIRNPAQLKSMIQKSVVSGAQSLTRKLLTQVEERFSDDVDLLNLSLNTYYAIQDLAAAERICRVILALEPQNAKLHARLGNLLSRQGDIKGAAVSFESALAFDRGNPEILERLTWIYLQLKNKNRAENFARKLRRVAPLNPKAHYYLARSLRSRKRDAEALEHAKRAAELDSDNERYGELVKILSNPTKDVRIEPG
jgi:tetratricopeptide (TPR) repeat protein